MEQGLGKLSDPWNVREEIVSPLEYVRAWGGRFVVPIPEVQVV